MPSLSAPLQSHVRAGERARALRPLAAAAFTTWLAALCSAGCRDMREDANYCTSCTGSEVSDGTQTDPQVTEPGSEPQGTTDPQSTSGGRTAGSMTTTSSQAGTGNGAQAASTAAPSGGASASSGASGVPTAGARGPQAGAAARGGSGGPSSSERDAGTGDPGSGGMRDAGAQEPTEPEPTPDAGPMTPPPPCNGQCPNDRPVCDETKAVPQCVQCTADEQFACVGDTSTCDVAQQKCVQCTPDDARHCDNATPTCNKDNRCVVCTTDLATSCPAAQPICDNEQRCVECLPGMTQYCQVDRPMCNADGRCVECMEDAQCQNPAKPRCDRGSNSCVGCERAEDCGRFPATRACDEESKACVACSPTGDLCPAGYLCDRDIYQCVPGVPKKRGCEPCGGNSDCADSASVSACLEGQQDNGRFCFTATDATAPLCEQGYTATRGPAGIMYCMPVGSLTCTAINNALRNTSCNNSNDCGRGGQCPMAPDNTCKLPCNDSQGCPAPLYCDPVAKLCKAQ